MTERIIREPERKNLTGIALSTWKRYQKKGLAPNSIPLLGNTRGYYISEIEEWIETRRPGNDN